MYLFILTVNIVHFCIFCHACNCPSDPHSAIQPFWRVWTRIYLVFLTYQDRILKMSVGKKKKPAQICLLCNPRCSILQNNFKDKLWQDWTYWSNFWTMIRMDLTSRELLRVQTENSSARTRDTSHSSFRPPEVPEPEPPRYNLTV